MMTASLRSSARRMQATIRARLSPTLVWKCESMPASASCSPIQAELLSTIWPSSSSVPTATTSQRMFSSLSPLLRASRGRHAPASLCVARLVPVAQAPISRAARPGRSGRFFLGAPAYGSPQHRDHRPRRPRQDHPGRPPDAAERHLPRRPEARRARARFQRPRARARHHDPRQMHLRGLARHPDQHRRHAGPRRLRRRGRAHPLDGRWRAAAGRRRRGADAADQVRARQGSAPGPAPDRRDQQGRPRRPARARGPRRGVRSVRGARRERCPARFSDPVRLGPRGLGDGRPEGRPERRHGAAVRADPPPRGAAQGRPGRAVRHARDHARARPASRPPADRPDRIRAASGRTRRSRRWPATAPRSSRPGSPRSSRSAASSGSGSRRRAPATSWRWPASTRRRSPTRCAISRSRPPCRRSRSTRRRSP